MHNAPPALSSVPLHFAEPSVSSANATLKWALAALVVAATGLVTSLLWDFSWESTVGVDLVWSPPHTATYLAVTITGIAALTLILRTTVSAAGKNSGIRFASLEG